MAISHAKPGEQVHLPLGAALASTKTTTLVKSVDLEVIRIVVPAGKEIKTHSAPGPMTLQCVEGRVLFTALGKSHELDAGKFLFLSAGEPHAVKGIEDSSLLVTILLPKKEPQQRLDMVQEASEESFPASDSPAITAS